MMADPQVAFDMDIKDFRRIEPMLKAIERYGGDLKGPLKRWGIYQQKQTDVTFRKEGRGPVRWPKLSAYTIAMRNWSGRGKGSRKPLQVSGHLRASIDTVFTKTRKGAAQVVFTKVKYAKTHQDGGSITRPARTIEPKNKKALAFVPHAGRSGGGQLVIVKRVHQPERTFKVPARPFLFILDADKRKGLELMMEHSRETIKKAGFK